MESLDATILNTAIPVMSYSLSVPPVSLKIALISYLLTLAIFIPISGWIADKYGIKQIFMLAIALFGVSSIACGFAANLPMLIIARILQGIGGSLTIPVGRLILARTFARNQLVTIMNRVIMVGAFGLMLGPVLGGFITHYFSWHWIFWINAPVACFALLLVQRYFEKIPPVRVPPLDILGFILFGSSLAGLMFGFSALSEAVIPTSVTVIILGLACLLLFSYLFYSRKRQHTIVNAALFNFRTFKISILGNLCARLGVGGVPFLLPLLLQISLGFSPQTSGLLLAPMAAGVLLIKPFTLNFLRYFGYKKLLIFNTVLLALSIASFTLINIQTSIIMIILLTFIFGFLIALQYTGMNSLAYSDIPSESLSSATSIISTTQQFSQSLGVAIGALLLHYATPKMSNTILLTPSTFHHAFLGMGILTLFSIYIFIKLKPCDGHQMIHSD